MPGDLTNPGVQELPPGVREVSIPSDAGYCAGWHYGPGSTGTCVVMAPGVGALKELGLPRFAERFAAAGHDVLIFDFRHFGQSGGEPRQVAEIAKFRADFSAAADFARTLPGIRRERIVLWGMSFGGGLVFDLAARLDDIAAAVAQCPMSDGPAASREVPFGLRRRIAIHALRDRAGALAGQPPRHIALAAPAGEVAMRSSAEAMKAPAAINPLGYPWPQQCAARFMLEIATYRPGEKPPRSTARCSSWSRWRTRSSPRRPRSRPASARPRERS